MITLSIKTASFLFLQIVEGDTLDEVALAEGEHIFLSVTVNIQVRRTLDLNIYGYANFRRNRYFFVKTDAASGASPRSTASTFCAVRTQIVR